MDIRSEKLYDKCECMSLLCQRACNHWSFVKFIFQIPLILTSSVMCILNSFDKGNGDMKIPNVVVNGVSVLLVSYQSNLKVAEKVELFKNLSNQFLQLAHDIEGREPETLDRNSVNILIEKYDALISSCLFEDIPRSIKKDVVKIFEGKSLPLQLNGGSGLSNKRSSKEIELKLSSQIV
tara:strand:- start:408 stop:944 length:537 start_codon:yes stop_codon:yes gene_type:complete